VADAFDLLDQQVHGFGWPVGQAGAVPAQDLGFPAAHGGGEAAELDEVDGTGTARRRLCQSVGIRSIMAAAT
jgi:hypothetical protein